VKCLIPVCISLGLTVGKTSDAKPSLPSAKKILVVADPWCPYNCDQSSHDLGFMVDVAREVLSAHGYEVSYLNMPWLDAMRASRSGQADAVIGAGPSEAKDMVLAGEPLGQNKTCLYTRSDDPYQYRPGQSLKGRRLGVASGYLYGDGLDQYIDANRAEYNLVQFAGGTKPLLENYRKLVDRRIDTVVENFLVMEFSVRKYRLTGVKLAGCDEASTLHIAFSPKRADSGHLAELINQGVRDLRRSGRLKEILARYNTTDWK